MGRFIRVLLKRAIIRETINSDFFARVSVAFVLVSRCASLSDDGQSGGSSVMYPLNTGGDVAVSKQRLMQSSRNISRQEYIKYIMQRQT